MRSAAHGKLLAVVLLTTASFLPSTPAQATFPGADGLLVFSYEAPVPGEGLTQSDLFTMAPDGSSLVRLTSTPFRHELAPAWSPDGTRIAFTRMKAPFGFSSVWTMAADGSDQRRLTTGFDARDPTWSPSGRRIAVTWFSGPSAPDIATMQADGTEIHRVTSWPSREFEPAWSPDGSTIAFTRGFDTGDVGDLWTLELGTGSTRRVTASPGYDHQVGWSPDGALLTFQQTFDTISKIATVAPDGSGYTRLTRGNWDGEPVFAPTGTAIVFTSDRGELFLPDLWVMDPDGTNLERLRDRRYASTMPDWQPAIT